MMYEIPKDDNIGRVTITKEYLEGCGGPRIEIRGSETPLLTGGTSPVSEAPGAGSSDDEFADTES